MARKLTAKLSDRLTVSQSNQAMGQRKILASEEVKDIKKTLDFVTEEVSAVRLQQKNILDLVK